MKYNLDELPDTWFIVFNGPDTDGKKTAVYERVSANGDGQVDHYRHVNTLDEVRRNYSHESGGQLLRYSVSNAVK